ncbi:MULTISPECIES: hypothetical protein [Roseovarius]|uniref:hypothetical protein n=1 Tax=Roseovarius TaxID=74030 RepID=UPI00273DFE40|nr:MULTISPECIES: hypothetical protein [unclassified Roseovarius]
MEQEATAATASAGSILTVWVPLLSAIVGGLIAIIGQVFVHWILGRKQRNLDCKRKETLLFMLDPEHMPKDVEWRDIKTLQRIIGASEEETKRLLIEVGARGSTLENDVWALIEHKPFPKTAGAA